MRYRGCDIGWRVPKAERKDLGRWGRGQKRRTERKNSFSISCGTFREDDNYALGMAENESLQVDKRSIGGRCGLRWSKSTKQCLE